MRRSIVAILFAVFLASLARAEDAPLGKPTTFPEAVRALRKAVFLVGYRNGHGTAWCISKEHRLLVTNVHVADMFSKAKKENFQFQALMNGNRQSYRVTGVWAHPGVHRFPTPDRKLSVRATNPDFGDVDPASPDVAALQLGPEGPDLPAEFSLAPRDILFDLQSLPVAILGYPGSDTRAWPAEGGLAQATFHEGVVSRVTDFRFNAVEDELAQCLQYTMDTFSGFSGSPIFLRNGEVVGLHNSSRPGGAGRRIANGIRADSLWELIVHHRLDEKVRLPARPPEKLVRRWSLADPQFALYSQLRKLEKEANDLVFVREDFDAGVEKCNEAIALYKLYAPIYRTRSMAYANMEFTWIKRLSAEARRQLLLKAAADADIYVGLHDNLTPFVLQTRIVVMNNLGHLTKQRKFMDIAYEDASKIVQQPGVSKYDRAQATNSMGVALSNMGDSKAALRKYDEAIQIDPNTSNLWDTRARYFEGSENETAARYNLAMAAALRKRSRLLSATGGKDRKLISKVKEKLTAQDPTDGRNCHYHQWETELEAGYFYQIDLTSPTFKNGKGYDPILRLYDAKGTLIQEDDDGGGFPHSRIFYTPSEAGKYRFVVTSYNQRDTGPYILNVERLAADR